MPAWHNEVQGGVAPLAYAEQDNPKLLQEWFELDMERGTRAVELAIQGEPDYILFGGSGTITLASPALARKIGSLLEDSGRHRAQLVAEP